MPLTAEERAYAAGLFDGEGSISASPSHHCQHNFRVTLNVGMCDREPVDWLAATFGGRVRTEKRLTKTGKPVFTWSLYCRKAAGFLVAVLPYLKTKHDRAVYAVRLATLARSRRTAKTHVFTETELAQRQVLARAIRDANLASNGRLACH